MRTTKKAHFTEIQFVNSLKYFMTNPLTISDVSGPLKNVEEKNKELIWKNFVYLWFFYISSYPS